MELLVNKPDILSRLDSQIGKIGIRELRGRMYKVWFPINQERLELWHFSISSCQFSIKSIGPIERTEELFSGISIYLLMFFFRANTRCLTKFYKFSNFLRTLEIVTIKIERNTISYNFQFTMRSISCIIINGHLRSKHNSAKWAADVGRIDYSGEKPIHRSVSNALSNLVPFLDRRE